MNKRTIVDGHAARFDLQSEQPGAFAHYRVTIEHAGVFDVMATWPHKNGSWRRWSVVGEKKPFIGRRTLVEHLLREHYVAPETLHAVLPTGAALCGVHNPVETPSGKALTCLACLGILRHLGRHYLRGRKL